MELKELQGLYGKYEKKHKLPSFEKVNGVFEIDKIDKESACFLRVVRKTMMDKIINSLSFLDMILNPVNAPRIYMPAIKALDSKDRKQIEKIYGVFGDLSLACLALEVDYFESKEAEMISRIYKDWNTIREEFDALLNRMIKPREAIKKEKGYFG